MHQFIISKKVKMSTPPKLNMDPEKQPILKGNESSNFKSHHFSGSMFKLQGFYGESPHLKISGGNSVGWSWWWRPMTSENDMDQLTYQWVRSGKVTWLAGKSPFSIGNTSSIRGHFSASQVSLPGGKHSSNWMLHMDGFSVFILFFSLQHP